MGEDGLVGGMEGRRTYFDAEAFIDVFIPPLFFVFDRRGFLVCDRADGGDVRFAGRHCGRVRGVWVVVVGGFGVRIL